MGGRFSLATSELEQRSSNTDSDAVRVDRKAPATTRLAVGSFHRRGPGAGFRLIYYVVMFLTGGMLVGVLYLASISE